MTDDPNIPHPIGCVIASGTVLPELSRVRTMADDVMREHRAHDDRLNRLHLQSDDASRRLTRLENMVEAQTKESHQLTRRLDSLDSKVGTLVDSLGAMRNSIDTLVKAFSDHGIAATEQHQKRMRGQMSLWVVFGGCLVVLSALHYQSTGTTPLQAIADLAAGLIK